MKRIRNSERKRNLVSVPKAGVIQECDSNPKKKLSQDMKSEVYKKYIFIINMSEKKCFLHCFFLLEIT